MNRVGPVIRHAVVFEQAVGHRMLCAQRFVLAWPDLFHTALVEVDLALRTDHPLLFAVARFKPEAYGPDTAARFSFWTQRAGGIEVAVSDLELLARANFLARFERCDHQRVKLDPGGLPAAFEEILSRLKISQDRRKFERVRARLEVSLGDVLVRSRDVSARGLFVLTERKVKVGELVPLLVTVPEPRESFEVEGRVAHAQPTGFGLALQSPPVALLAALENLCAANEAAVSAPLEARAPDARETFTVKYPTGAALAAELPTLLANGMFLRTGRELKLRGEVAIDLQLPDGLAFAARGTVVSVEQAGVGLELHFEPSVRQAFREAITRNALPPASRGVAPAASPSHRPPRVEVRDPSVLSLVDLIEPPRARPPAPPPDALTPSVLSLVDLIEPPPPRPPAPPPDALTPSVLSLVDLIEQPPPAPPADEPLRRMGNYELLSLLGRGGMAEVYYARGLAGPEAGKFVAIKRLSDEMAARPEAVDLFIGEADILRMLKHPNIVKTLEIGVLESQYFLVMEAVDGRDLGQVLRRCKQRKIRLPIDFACFLAKTLADALDCAHRATNKAGAPLNLVHCDVSPHNVFISRAGEIKLGDFGLAQTAGTAPPRGKPAYLSPETLDGEVSVQSDLWAVTVVLYELLTLEAPFVGDSQVEVLEAVRKRRWAPARQLRPDIPAALEAVLKKGFAKKPKDRFGSAAEFAAALAPHFDPNVGTPLAIGAVVRGLFG